MFCRATTFLCLAIATLVAQEPPLPKALVEVGRTTARGGNCEHILLSRDARRMLTVGETGELLWWDLGERRLLQRVPGRAIFLSAVALHPTEPWAIVGAAPKGDWTGMVWRCDLETGAVTELWTQYAQSIAFTAAGDHVRVQWRTGDRQSREAAYRSETLRGAGPFEEVTDAPRATFVATWLVKKADSPDGKHYADCNGAEVRCRGVAPRTIRFDAVETSLEAMVIANDGTVVAADSQGQVHVVSLDGTTTVLAGHTGDAHQLVFSPDGRFLAVVGLGATRVVDLAGNDVAEWSGTRIVLRGPDGADFWILDRNELRRWSASTRRDVVPSLRWNGPAASLLRNTLYRDILLPSVDGPSLRLFTVGAACVVDGVPWFSADPHIASFGHVAKGTWTPVTDRQWVLETPIALLARRDGRVTCVAGRSDDGLAMRPRSYVDLRNSAGALTATWELESPPTWVAHIAPNDAVCICMEGSIVVRDHVSLAELARREFVGVTAPAVPFGANRLLTAMGGELLVLDGRSLETLRSLPQVGELTRIDVVAASPTGRHVAVARRSDVRILRIE